MARLKFCPHCLSTDVAFGYLEIAKLHYICVVCNGCQARGGTVPTRLGIEDEPKAEYEADRAEMVAAEKWNRRVEDAPAPFDPWSLPEVGVEYDALFPSGRIRRGRFSIDATGDYFFAYEEPCVGRRSLADLRVWRRVGS